MKANSLYYITIFPSVIIVKWCDSAHHIYHVFSIIQSDDCDKMTRRIVGLQWKQIHQTSYPSFKPSQQTNPLFKTNLKNEIFFVETNKATKNEPLLKAIYRPYHGLAMGQF